MDGEVVYYKYHPGCNKLAFLPKSSELNEHASSAIRTPGGDEIFFKQIAGTFARRIVCYSEPGLSVHRGKQCGVIKFGSRIDMYLPLDADIKVKLGDLTSAVVLTHTSTDFTEGERAGETEYVFTYSVLDSGGNPAFATRTVIARDVTPPVPPEWAV